MTLAAYVLLGQTNYHGDAMKQRKPKKAALIWTDVDSRDIHALGDCEIVWAADTAANRRMAGQALSPDDVGRWSWFEVPVGTPSECLLAILELIEDHHGPYAQSEPWTDLAVLGIDESVVRLAIEDDDEFSVNADNGVHVLRN